MDDLEMRTIRIRNLFDSRIDEELLYELFLQAGPINSINMPVSPNGQKTFAIIEYTHEIAVPFAMFIFEGTELYGSRLYLQSNNTNPPTFYNQNSRYNNPSKSSFHEDFLDTDNIQFNQHQPEPNLIMNINTSPLVSNQPNFDALLQMGQNMFMPAPMLNMSSNFVFNSNVQNDFRNQSRNDNDFRDNRRERDRSKDQRRNNNRGNDYKNKSRDNFRNNWRR